MESVGARRLASVCLLALSGAVFLAVAFLAIAHIDDRYGVSAAPGVWMGLAAAAHAGVWYPPAFAHGFYGGTRYMPLPILLQLGGRVVSGEYLASAKLLIYATNVGLYALVYVAARRRRAPVAVSLALVAALLSSSAAMTTSLGIRWDALATLLQLAAILLLADEVTRNRAALAGLLCGLAFATKLSALWAPAAIVVWLAWCNRRALVPFAASLVGSATVVLGFFELLSHGRLGHQLRDFAFAGSSHSSLSDGLQRVYELVLRNQRSLPLLLLAAAVALGVAIARRRIELPELGLVFSVPILVVVMRDVGAYENHVIDLEVLAALVVAGLFAGRRVSSVLRLTAVVGVVLVLATALAARYTLVPDVRAAVRDDARYAVHPFPNEVAMGTCALFEDASIPVLAGQRPVVLDAFIVHRLQTQDRRALDALVARISQERFRVIVLTRPLTDAGWFATLDFGTAVAEAMRAHYRLDTGRSRDGFVVYQPRRASRTADCPVASLGRWS